jgi:hypothetical protein
MTQLIRVESEGQADAIEITPEAMKAASQILSDHFDMSMGAAENAVRLVAECLLQGTPSPSP